MKQHKLSVSHWTVCSLHMKQRELIIDGFKFAMAAGDTGGLFSIFM